MNIRKSMNFRCPILLGKHQRPNIKTINSVCTMKNISNHILNNSFRSVCLITVIATFMACGNDKKDKVIARLILVSSDFIPSNGFYYYDKMYTENMDTLLRNVQLTYKIVNTRSEKVFIPLRHFKDYDTDFNSGISVKYNRRKIESSYCVYKGLETDCYLFSGDSCEFYVNIWINGESELQQKKNDIWELLSNINIKYVIDSSDIKNGIKPDTIFFDISENPILGLPLPSELQVD